MPEAFHGCLGVADQHGKNTCGIHGLGSNILGNLQDCQHKFRIVGHLSPTRVQFFCCPGVARPQFLPPKATADMG